MFIFFSMLLGGTAFGFLMGWVFTRLLEFARVLRIHAIGIDFWHRLTGDDKFYDELRIAIAEVAMEADGMEALNDTIKKLAATDKIKQIAQ